MNNTNYKIIEEKNEIDDHLLDIIGNEFKFDHVKGLAEWLKNSVDAYIRHNIKDDQQYILLRFTDSNEASFQGKCIFECIDFVGMTEIDINKALKRWGDPEAAKRGLAKKVYGGHGNGGKFYMRQMFETAHFITYKEGLLNIFGFNNNKKYGFADNYKNKKISYSKALEVANVDTKDVPKIFLDKIKKGELGFTVVKGLYPKGMKNQINVNKISEQLRRHPQSMRIMERIHINVFYNSQLILENLKPDEIEPLDKFTTPFVFNIPEKIEYKSDNEIDIIEFSNKKYHSGKLIMKTSQTALTSTSKYSELNRIDVIGELGVVASYYLRELGLYYPQTDFLYGECICPILEDPNDDCVMNDRTKLADSHKTRALLDWIREQVKNLCEQISVEEEKEREEINKKLSSDYNNFLDKWKNNFMSKVIGELFSEAGDKSGSGLGLDEYIPSNNKRNNSDNDNKNIGNKGDGDKKKGSRFPKVLLSGHDEDPLNPGKKLSLQKGHGLVYQRAQDVKEGIYWINTSSPLAEAILNKYDANSPRWRDYLFQRYVDIFVKEALIKLEKKDPERFNAYTIDGEIMGKLVSTIHEAAAKDLNAFLFNDKYEIDT